jgi:hypothetical protein
MDDVVILIVGCGVTGLAIASALLAVIAGDYPNETRP